MVDLGQKKVNSCLPFFIDPNQRGWRPEGAASHTFITLVYQLLAFRLRVSSSSPKGDST